MNILLTGANGFVGKHFLQSDKNIHHIVTASVREHQPLPSLHGIDVVIHLGGKAHEMQPLPDNAYFEANAELTKQLAAAAKTAGVKQFIYASSVKVYGNVLSESLDEDSPCFPDDAYGKSKLLGEQYLQALADESFVVSIVRPPLVYGAYVKGNMLKLIQLAQKKVPLPFGNISNKRSMVYVENLVALINKLIEIKVQGIFIPGDSEPVSTTRLVSLIRKKSGKKPNLIYIPYFLQRIIKKFRYPLYIRLFGSFVINNQSTNRRLGFAPPFSMEKGIDNMVKWFKTTQQ